MIDGHRLRASSHLAELIRSRQVVKELKQAAAEIVDDDARLVTGYEIGGGRPRKATAGMPQAAASSRTSPSVSLRAGRSRKCIARYAETSASPCL